MFGTKHSKANRLQKTIEYQKNEQITKYSNRNMEIQGCKEIIKHNQVKLVLAGFFSPCLCQYSIKLY